jgi:hypothetical protein
MFRSSLVILSLFVRRRSLGIYTAPPPFGRQKQIAFDVGLAYVQPTMRVMRAVFQACALRREVFRLDEQPARLPALRASWFLGLG